MENYNISPYWDDYSDVAKQKGYTQILAVPGRAEQAREFTQAQSIQRDYLERLGSAVFSEGTIVNGCVFSINKETNTVIMSSGRIFLEGLVRIVDGKTLTIDGVGKEYVCVKVVTDIVTEDSDSSLRDPAQGYENYGQLGSHRERQLVNVFIAHDGDDTLSGSAVIAIISDGVLVNEAANTSSTSDTASNIVTGEMLAARTYDEGGNYKIDGLALKDRDEYDDNKIYLSVTNGKAYIKGYEVLKSAYSRVGVDKALDDMTIAAEPKIYTSVSTGDAGKDKCKYPLNYIPVKKINSITATIKITGEEKQRGQSQGGADALKFTPVKDILEVNAGGTLYVQNKDYRLYLDQVDWSLTGDGSKEPGIGETYTVTYTYNKQLVEGEDYELYEENGKYYINFINKSLNIVENSVFTVYYDFYLARRDLILLGSDGVLSVLKGKSDRYEYLVTPTNGDSSKMALGYVNVLPYSNKIEVTNYKVARLTQEEIYNLKTRIDDLEYNAAMSDLDTEAEAGESATSLKGIYTDGFIGITKSDLNNSEFNCCIDYELGEVTLPVNTMGSQVSLNPSSSTYSVIGRVLSAPFVPEIVLKQPYATDKMLVNPYAAYNPLAKVTLNPSIDNWVDTNKMSIYDTVDKKSYNTSRNTVSSYQVFGTHNYHSLQKSYDTKTTTLTGVTSSTAVSTAIAESIIEYMRVKTIQISGYSFESGEDNITCYFNEKKVDMTPVGDTKAGTEAGTVRCDESGSFVATITIPENTPCGSVSVELEGAISKGKAVYTANGTLKTTVTTTTTTNTSNYNVLITTHNVYESDPLAQSFVFSEDTVITRVGLYFSAKDATRPVVVQVRNMVNGYPGELIYAETVVPASQVNTSSDASAVTLVDFSQPVYCDKSKYYCFVVLSDCNSYQMFYGALAGTDISTHVVVTSQPYQAGVMFSSSNSQTWTAHQTFDLKFDLYRAKYTGKGELVFEDVPVTAINSLVLAAETVDYKNAGIDWFYRLTKSDGELDNYWYPLDTYTPRELSSVSKTISLKAELSVAYQTSPFIASDCINLIGFIDGTKASYVSKSVYLDTPYSALKIAYQAALPSGSACHVYYKDDANGEWKKLVKGANVTCETSQISEEFYEYTWELSKLSPSKFYKIKIELDTSSVFNKPRIRKLRSIMRY